MRRAAVLSDWRAWLGAALAVLLVGAAAASNWKGTHTACYDLQIDAARRVQSAQSAIQSYLSDNNMPIEPEDMNDTGLLGPVYTFLTTTVGSPEAKRTSCDPNWSALLVRWFDEAGLTAGDVLAVAASGSFPALTLAAVCAANAMGLEIRLIVSYGASMYGATREAFTTVAMLAMLREQGLAQYTLLAVSPGGENDQGENALYPDARQRIDALAAQSGAQYLTVPPPAYPGDPSPIVEGIQQRLSLFGADVRCFVNIGSASANVGGQHWADAFPSGLVLSMDAIPEAPDRGLLYEYAARGVPVVHLLSLRQLAEANGLPYDPQPLPQPGEGAVYWAQTAPNLPAILSLLLAAFMSAYAFLLKKRSTLPFGS